jgi:hypothetical protein
MRETKDQAMRTWEETWEIWAVCISGIWEAKDLIFRTTSMGRTWEEQEEWIPTRFLKCSSTAAVDLEHLRIWPAIEEQETQVQIQSKKAPRASAILECESMALICDNLLFNLQYLLLHHSNTHQYAS